MLVTPDKIYISEKIGAVSCNIMVADQPIANLIIGHGAGAGMDHPFMVSLSEHLRRLHISTIRYQFPYMEMGKKMPDRPSVAHKTIEEVINVISKSDPEMPLFVGGKSFGGRMTSQLLAKRKFNNVTGIVFYGFPLHPPGKPSIDRADHLNDIDIPLLFLRGTRDNLSVSVLMEEVISKLSNARIQNIEGADHSFNMLKSSGITTEEIIHHLAATTAEWISSVLHKLE